MYAIVVNGARQHRVELGSRILLDYQETAIGEDLELNEVLLVQDGAETLIGRPRLAGARVIAEVTGMPGKKTIIQKFRRRKNYRRLKGHTQPYVEVEVKHILKAGETVPATSEATPAPSETPATA